MLNEPEIKLQISASLIGDIVKITYQADKVLNNVDFNIALVQKEEKYSGSNGIVFHKLVVREFINVRPESSPVSINITESEQAAAKHLLDFEEERSFKFPEKHFKIDRSQLRVVFFIQDQESKKVYNAVVADVK